MLDEDYLMHRMAMHGDKKAHKEWTKELKKQMQLDLSEAAVAHDASKFLSRVGAGV